MITKTCRDSACPSAGAPLDPGCFHANRSMPDGLSTICGPCARRRQRESRARRAEIRELQHDTAARLLSLMRQIDEWCAGLDAQLAALNTENA